MPSDIARQIVDQIYNDEKAKSIDSVADALGAISYDAIQQGKQDFVQSWGFNPDDTAQGVADELEDQLPDGTDIEYTDVDVDERQPHESPEAEYETDEQEPEE